MRKTILRYYSFHVLAMRLSNRKKIYTIRMRELNSKTDWQKLSFIVENEKLFQDGPRFSIESVDEKFL